MKNGLCAACATEQGLVMIPHPSCEIHRCEICGRIPADSPNNWVTLKAYYENEEARLNRENRVINGLDEIKGWEITDLWRWRPGIVRYAAERDCDRGRERITGYAKDEVFDRLQIPL